MQYSVEVFVNGRVACIELILLRLVIIHVKKMCEDIGEQHKVDFQTLK